MQCDQAHGWWGLGADKAGLLLHAALTRARKLVVVVGPNAAIEAALQGVQGDVRLSSLNGRLSAAAASLGLARSAAGTPLH